MGSGAELIAGEPDFFRRAEEHAGRTAIVDARGRHRYDELLAASGRIGNALAGTTGPARDAATPPPPVAFLVEPGFGWAATLWGIWRAGRMAVPLAPSHPPAELEYAIRDSGAGSVVVDALHATRLGEIGPRLGVEVHTVEALLERPETPGWRPRRPIGPEDPALAFYTSGTTGTPKGVVHTHATVEAQVRSLVAAWEWRSGDVILNVLPLHHVHGVVNVVLCALWSGATGEFAGFDADAVWRRFAAGGLTLFMAVPTIYARLVAAFDRAGGDQQARMRKACRGFRLMVSGSAALPVPLWERWREISGQALLERYGMTETGMALSNPLHGPRRPGHVGQPLPSVELRIVDETGRPVTDGLPGEIEVRGPTVFRGYLGRPEATAEAFRDGWFRTGDVAVVEDGSHRILGRKSVDIIKSGGYKLSALEIEAALGEHPGIAECAVIGVPDEEYGERVAAVVVLRPGATLELEQLRMWARERLAGYKLPTRLREVTVLPRNAMGKVVKPDLAALFT